MVRVVPSPLEMEDKIVIEQTYQQDEKVDKKDETNQDDKVIHISKTKHLLENSSKEEKPKPKPKPGMLKQNQKTKITVPKPFSLETEKRMSRERRGSMDFKEYSKPKLSKSVSLNYSANAKYLVGTGGTTSTIRHADSTNTAAAATTITRSGIPRRKATATDHVGKRVEIPVTRAKSSLLGQQGKYSSDPNLEQKQAKGKSKVVSKTISSTAKETIGKLVRATHKSLVTPQKETLKVVTSSA